MRSPRNGLCMNTAMHSGLVGWLTRGSIDELVWPGLGNQGHSPGIQQLPPASPHKNSPMSHTLRRLRPLAAGLGAVGGFCLQAPAAAQRGTASSEQPSASGKWAWSAGAAGSSTPAEPTGGGKSYADWVADENTIRIPLESLVAECLLRPTCAGHLLWAPFMTHAFPGAGTSVCSRGSACPRTAQR